MKLDMPLTVKQALAAPTTSGDVVVSGVFLGNEHGGVLADEADVYRSFGGNQMPRLRPGTSDSSLLFIAFQPGALEGAALLTTSSFPWFPGDPPSWANVVVTGTLQQAMGRALVATRVEVHPAPPVPA